tara:strand:- start:1 stop:120 length:120 start_codon:yes stop_codon:yes gene_type:complete
MEGIATLEQVIGFPLIMVTTGHVTFTSRLSLREFQLAIG